MEHAEKLRRGREITASCGPEIRRKYEAGASTLELAAEYGLSNYTVWRTIKVQGGELRGRNAGITRGREVVAEQGAQIAIEYASGDSLSTLAARYGIAASSVAKAVRANGGAVRTKGARRGVHCGPKSSGWKGGTFIKEGYRHVWVPADSPYINMTHKNRPYAPEHRLVMAEMVKRPLLPSETVHHINGDRLDNRPENLQLRTGKHGTGIHLRCRDCGSQNVGPAKL